MSHPLYEVTSFLLMEVYTIEVEFDDGTSQVIDLEPVLYGELYGPLRDPDLFRQAYLHPEIKTLVWPNGADFDPYVLHEWPRVVEELASRLQATMSEES